MAQVLPGLREPFLDGRNRIGVGEVESINILFTGDQIPALDDGHFIVERVLLLISIIGKYHPGSLPVDEPARNVLSEKKWPQCFFFDFNRVLPTTTMFRLVAWYQLQNLAAIFDLVEH